MTEQQEIFFRRLNKLESGERAALRRQAGRLLGQADGKSVVTFYRCLPGDVSKWQEDRWFVIACLRCLWDAGEEGGRPLEQLIREMMLQKELSDSTGHRIETLIDGQWDDDGYQMTKLVRLVKMIRQRSDRAKIDFAGLLDDLIAWNYESQSVQRKWARTIFSSEKKSEKEEE